MLVGVWGVKRGSSGDGMAQEGLQEVEDMRQGTSTRVTRVRGDQSLASSMKHAQQATSRPPNIDIS